MASRPRAAGFTLIEIMVVVVIIGLLATLVGPKIWQMLGFGQKGIAEAKCREYYNDAKRWQLMGPTRKLPSSLEEMVAPAKEGEENFLHKIDDDPWGGKYRLESDGKRVRVCSNGPDGIEGTEDDVCFPELEER